MTDQSRVWKVLLVLLTSMTVGTVVLMSLGNNAPVAGAFSLSSYYKLTPPSQAIVSRKSPQAHHWNRIEVIYSGTRMGDAKTLAILQGLSGPANLNTHFVVCNGRGCDSENGQIQATEHWQTQQAIHPQQNWGQPDRTISICVIADGQSTPPTDCQIRRVSALTEILRHRFHIAPSHVHWPGDY